MQVRRVEVRVAFGHPRVAVAHDPLHEPGVRAAHGEQAAGRVPQVVEADWPDHLGHPQLVVLLVAGALPEARIGRCLDVATSRLPALVAVAARQPRLAERAAEDHLELRGLRVHRPVLARKHQLARRDTERVLEVRPEFAGDRNRVAALALRRDAIVGALDHDDADLEIDIRLAQPEQLTLAEAGVDRRREEIAPLRSEGGEDERNLVEAQKVGQALGHHPPPHAVDRVRARHQALADRRLERAPHELAQVVQALRPERLALLSRHPLLGLEVVLDLG
ncbi:MAG TPA: hypothetical protein VHO06_15675 [Polyangia bacterium]|nr:hypothetical protein [Polyangia bacterium]